MCNVPDRNTVRMELEDRNIYPGSNYAFLGFGIHITVIAYIGIQQGK